MLKERQTVDIVVIILTCTIGSVITVATIGIIVGKTLHPTMDTSRGAEMIAQVITTIVGALVGFIGGRAYGKSEANGKNTVNGGKHA
jgi:putative flippase GtrA